MIDMIKIDKDEVLTVSIVSQRLKGIIPEDYKWPNVPEGYQLEFIVHPDGTLIMDLLNPDRGMFISEAENVHFETPRTVKSAPLTWQDLEKAGVPFMS